MATSEILGHEAKLSELINQVGVNGLTGELGNDLRSTILSYTASIQMQQQAITE